MRHFLAVHALGALTLLTLAASVAWGILGVCLGVMFAWAPPRWNPGVRMLHVFGGFA